MGGFRIFMVELAAFLFFPALAAGVAHLMAAHGGIDTPAVRNTVTAGYLIFSNITAPVLLIASLAWVAVEAVNRLWK